MESFLWTDMEADVQGGVKMKPPLGQWHLSIMAPRLAAICSLPYFAPD